MKNVDFKVGKNQATFNPQQVSPNVLAEYS